MVPVGEDGKPEKCTFIGCKETKIDGYIDSKPYCRTHGNIKLKEHYRWARKR